MAVIHKTYQMRAYTSASGYDRIASVLLKCAQLYNAGLEEWRSAYRQSGVSRTYHDQSKQLTLVRKDDPEGWGSISVQIGRGVLRRLDRARQSFFRRVKDGQKAGYPRFKSWRRYHTIEISEPSPAMVKQRGSHYVVVVKGLPAVRLRKGLDLPSSEKLKSLSITKRGRRLWVQLTYEVEMAQLARSAEVVGLDMGVSDRIALSTGERIGRRKKPIERLKRAQQRLSRCRKGSKRWRERRAILSNAQHRERVSNRNECHRLTTEIVHRFGLIAIEGLVIGSMTASAKGTVDNPGKNVSQKSGLNRSISEQTWGMIRQQLTYKAAWAGRELVVVDPRYTSQTCSRCEYVSSASRDGKGFKCSRCGYVTDADINAAVNILHRGLAGGNLPAAALDAA